MASKQDSGQEGGRRSSRSDLVRSAVDQAFQEAASQGTAAAETGRERAQDIVDQLAQAAGRVRDVLDELRPPTGDELRTLQETVAALEQRVAALERAQTSAPKPKPKPAARRSAAKPKKTT
jgi:polyhydroxyalkanoate synthesis regulator phasin